jgi:hypothetical protein
VELALIIPSSKIRGEYETIGQCVMRDVIAVSKLETTENFLSLHFAMEVPETNTRLRHRPNKNLNTLISMKKTKRIIILP